MLDDHEREQLNRVMQNNRGEILKQTTQDILPQSEEESDLETVRVFLESQINQVREGLIERFGELWKFADIAHYHTLAGNCLFIATLVVATGGAMANLCFKVVEMNEQGFHFLSVVK